MERKPGRGKKEVMRNHVYRDQVAEIPRHIVTWLVG